MKSLGIDGRTEEEKWKEELGMEKLSLGEEEKSDHVTIKV